MVNEPYIFPYRTDDVFYHGFGSYDYITVAFRAAREADPSATLIFNDTCNHTPNGLTTALTRRILVMLRKEGLVDSVGLQMHIDGANPPTKEEVIKTMRSYGIPVKVTEFDVDMRNVSGSQEERKIKQAKIYQDMLGACLESGVCTDFSVWGIGDNLSWLEVQQNAADADPTPFDDNLNPKPAYYAILQALLNSSMP